MTIPNPPDIKDASNFEKIPEKNIPAFLTYALNSTRLIFDSINRCETKASAQIPIILTFYGGYYLWIKAFINTIPILQILFYINTTLVAISILFSVLCIWVRKIPIPPSIPNILEWLKDKSDEIVQKSLFASIFFNLAVAEYENFKIVRSKSHLLILSQGAFLIFLFIALWSTLITITN